MKARRYEGLKPLKKQTVAGVRRDWNGFLRGRTITRLHWDFRKRDGRRQGLVGFTLDDGRYIGVNAANGIFFTQVD